MKLETINIEKLKPVEKNVRMHTRTQLDEIYRSFKMFKQYKNIVIDEENIILAGNALYQALKEHGEKKIIVFRKLGLSKIMKKKSLITDNRTSEIGTGNNENLLSILKELKEAGDLDLPGYNTEVLDILLKTDSLEEIEAYGDIGMEKIKEIEENRLIMQEKEKQEKSEIVLTNEKIQVEDDKGAKRPYIICEECGKKIWL